MTEHGYSMLSFGFSRPIGLDNRVDDKFPWHHTQMRVVVLRSRMQVDLDCNRQRSIKAESIRRFEILAPKLHGTRLLCFL
ncbi:hypothetical protein AS149_34465 [Burkholderia cenocepacia]|nr:hypothetical protein AS149_34465 [Burkholderia cenocepacia]